LLCCAHIQLHSTFYSMKHMQALQWNL